MGGQRSPYPSSTSHPILYLLASGTNSSAHLIIITTSLLPPPPHHHYYLITTTTSSPPLHRFLLDEGVEYLRTYLNLPAEVVPDTQKKKHQALERRPREFGDRPPRRFEGGDRDGYRRGGFGRGGGGFGGADKVCCVRWLAVCFGAGWL